ncbi:ribosomal protein subunit L19 [Schizosaccharomyces octosporus yFS286]|uniref:Large ribosomal subunit protein uL11m n=1 Tax=Schizosaccharomyces octosporus (strain yFS286) TaxID=483514 RepID=S9PV43_SCHOY|nr:ribosomal protein subunit L19 [Schizosaccharomyces octosporus yFS286]EPX71383.1 ribosomal protein subunit L19 [Schizosaccharomyces octosporus yFS286]
MSAPKASLVKLVVPAGKAAPTPPIGPALGARGVKSIDFCKEFNARTVGYVPTVPIPCRVTVTPQRTFSFTIHTPPTSWLICKTLDIEKGSSSPKHDIKGQLSLKHVYEIAKLKSTDPTLKGTDLKSLCKSVIGTAKSMGVQVVL